MTSTPSREPTGVEDAGALAPELLVRMHDAMLLSRCLEERLIRMNKQGDGFFWVGGPGRRGAQRVRSVSSFTRGRGRSTTTCTFTTARRATLARDGRGSDRHAPPDEEHGDRPVFGGPQLLQPLLGAAMERRSRVVADRGAVLDGARHRDGEQARRAGKRHHHRAGRRRRARPRETSRRASSGRRARGASSRAS